MQAKQYLKQAYRLDELIKCNKEELADLRLLSKSISSTDYTKDRVQTSQDCDAGFTKIIDKIVVLENIINDEIEKMLSLKLEIREVINTVQDNEERLLLKYRYLNFMSWDDVCDQMCVSLRTAHRIHATALANVVIPNKNLKDDTH